MTQIVRMWFCLCAGLKLQEAGTDFRGNEEISDVISEVINCQAHSDSPDYDIYKSRRRLTIPVSSVNPVL